MRGDRVKLTKCDTDEWNEECHSASNILSEWPNGEFAVLLSYYILKGSDFLSEV